MDVYLFCFFYCLALILWLLSQESLKKKQFPSYQRQIECCGCWNHARVSGMVGTLLPLVLGTLQFNLSTVKVNGRVHG